MKFRTALVVLATGLCLTQWVHAQVAITRPWVRATAPGQKVAAAYMEIKSTGPATLISVASPVAGMAEVHETTMENGMMKMRPVERLALPAGKTVELKPGGYHIMLMGVARPLKPGDTVPISLTIETPDRKRRSVEVAAKVTGLAGPGAHRKMD